MTTMLCAEDDEMTTAFGEEEAAAAAVEPAEVEVEAEAGDAWQATTRLTCGVLADATIVLGEDDRDDDSMSWFIVPEAEVDAEMETCRCGVDVATGAVRCSVDAADDVDGCVCSDVDDWLGSERSSL